YKACHYEFLPSYLGFKKMTMYRCFCMKAIANR
ncbi:MAG: hypothetical protein ACI8UP_004326, partial [Porticoccaceae bacterium]